MAECLIGLGSNLGDRATQLERACALFCGHPQIHGVRRSTFYPTTPIGGPAGQKPYLNAVLRVTTSLSPHELLAVGHNVEQQLGRQRRERWGPRVIDIDILLYDQLLEETAELVLPHPRMALRRFVLAPACEVASDMIHPSTGWTIGKLLHRLDAAPHYVALAGVDAEQTMNLAVMAAHITGARVLLDPLPLPKRWSKQLGRDATSQGRELQVIDARREQLRQLLATTCSAASDWHVCNYWLPQSMAVAHALLEGAARQAVERACMLAMQQVPVPNCTLFLETPTPAADTLTAAQLAAGTLRESPDCATAYARALSHQASLPFQGPILRMRGGDLQLALTELTAAIDAMR
jgi:2-amino-4-hydroxy-6-hydroxymethyldihydropteridine diphosphokinase